MASNKSIGKDAQPAKPKSGPVYSVNQLATHLPDQVVYADHSKQMPYQNTFQGVLMFLDISGFTALCEKYSMSSKYGTDQLTKTLNAYMNALVNEILQNDGDILKFAGDAILTLWPVDSFLRMKVTVSHVIMCAMSIQEKYGEWSTSVGVKLRVKIGIAAGEVNVVHLGNNEFCHYVTMGRAVESVNKAEKLCVSGDTVLSPSAWVHCAGIPLEHELLDDNKHHKVTSMVDQSSASSYNMSRTLVVTESVGVILEASEISKKETTTITPNLTMMSNKKLPSLSSIDAKSLKTIGTLEVSTLPPPLPSQRKLFKPKLPAVIEEQIVRVRKAIVEKFLDDLDSQLRLYVTQPVIRKMEEGQPLEYLSEMRSVTIVFINLILDECTKFQFLQTLQNSFNIIYRTSKHLQGCLNKVFMFDKGCTFLVIFGVPGLKHEKDCAHALQSAYRMKTELDKLEKIERTSIGTTTGSTFCGVVGHNHRHEYTVIGRKVNMAARLMMHYPGMVTCDNETFHHSKLLKGNFTQLDLKEMKGLQNVGIIRQFIEDTSWKATIKALQKQEFESPLIGREREMARFTQELYSIKTSANAASQRQVIVFEGEAGIGKSRLLDAIIIKAHDESMSIVACSLTMQDSKTPYYVVTCLLMDLFEFDYETPHQEREYALFQMFQDPFVIENLPILNDLLHLKLPQCEKYLRMDSDLRIALFHDLLRQVVHEVTQRKGFIVFTVDDAHLMDPESWEFVSDLGRDMQSLVVLTLRTGTSAHVCNTAERILALPTTLHMDLHGLDSMYLAPLACQFLGVVQIPKRLESFLQTKSQGVPSWADQILREMFFRNILQIEPLGEVDSGETMVLPKAEYLSRKRRTSAEITEDLTGMKHEQQQAIEQFELKGKKASDDRLVCVIVPGASLDIGIPDSIKGMIQARVDRMEEMDQLIIKTASVLGLTFPLQMLQAVLPTKTTAPKLLEALQRLGRSGIFESVVPKTGSKRSQDKCMATDKHTDMKSEASILSKWRFVRFRSASIQETADGMLMERIRRTLHGNAAVYLESLAHKCEACGGGEFLSEHPTDDRTLDESAPDAKTATQTEVETSTSATPRTDATTTTCSGRMLHHGRRLTYRLDNVLHVDGKNIVESSEAARPSLNTIDEYSTRMERTNIAFSQALKKRFSRQIGDDPFAVVSTDTKEESDLKIKGGRSSLTHSRNVLCREAEGQEAAVCIDLRECKCLDLLNSVYPQLIRHWRAAGNVERTTHFLTEAAAAAIAVFNNMQALAHLREVSRILEAVKEGRNPFEKEVSHVEPVLLDDWLRARTESLLGQALFHMGNVSESFPHFKNALRILGTNIPKRKVGVWCATVREAIVQWKHRKFPDRYLGCDIESPNAHYLVEEADCLSHIFHHNVVEQNKDAALLTALQQLNLAERAQPELHKLILAYTCMMECCRMFNWPSLASDYEEKALVWCMTVLKNATLEDVVTTAYLYCTSLNMRLAFGKIDDAIYAGYMGNRITKKIHENDIRMHLLPTLSQALMMAERIKDTVSSLKELEYIRFEADDAIAQAWYYASCLDLLLEAGFQLEPFLKCVDFVQAARVDPIFQSDHLPLYYLSCCLSIWFQRRSNPVKSSIWEEVANENAPANQDNFRAMHGFVKLVEARLIALAHAFNGKKRDKIVKLVLHATKGMQQLKKSCTRLPVFLPRYYHLQAYYKVITRKPSAAKSLLEKGIAMSKRMGNVLEASWMRNSRRVWFDSDPKPDDYCFWLDQSKTNLVDWHLADEVDSSQLKYVMPLPDWLPKIVL